MRRRTCTGYDKRKRLRYRAGMFIASVLVAGVVLSGCGTADTLAGDNSGYTLRAEDEEGNSIAGVTFQICTDELCVTVETDENGTAVYDGEPAEYEIHVMTCPEEYITDDSMVYVTGSKYEDMVFVLKKASQEESAGAED